MLIYSLSYVLLWLSMSLPSFETITLNGKGTLYIMRSNVCALSNEKQIVELPNTIIISLNGVQLLSSFLFQRNHLYINHSRLDYTEIIITSQIFVPWGIDRLFIVSSLISNIGQKGIPLYFATWGSFSLRKKFHYL